jgi:cell volume regulation protein A
VILTVTATGLFLGQAPAGLRLAIDVPLQLVIGLSVGLAAGYAARWLLGRMRLATAGLYPVLTLGLGLLVFGAATLLQGSGFLAVFAAAVSCSETAPSPTATD